ncbi:hypothetical protein [Shewanella acanthi]|uniref:hypothetical protein n=1 Tax=Shewanella acanthi TaxID=2864212 RepID=UPI001C660657|nr:hypothetical protein [Shewanella acanthi]QYJ78229.1 hypothetical protein K0H61_14110 [Shewanella acanthi]
MLNRINSTLFGRGLQLWHLVVLMVLLFSLFVVFKANAVNNKHIALTCDARLYKSPFNVNAAHFSQSLKLDVEIKDKRVKLNYRYRIDDHDLAAIIYNGTVSTLEAGTMTYKLDLDQANLKMDLLEDEVPEPIRDEIKQARVSLLELGEMSYDLQIVEMDRINDFTLIKFYPSGNLWACSGR